MRWPVLALLTRALQVESRRPAAYLVRGGLVLIILLDLAGVVVATLTAGSVSAPGRTFFTSVVYINFFFISLAGMVYFASAIAEEKEEMTLGLLRMTRLNPISILLGKSTSRMISVCFLLLAQFPYTLLAVTLGGVSLRQIFAAYATLLAWIVFLNGLALWCSVVCKRSARAATLTFILILGFFIAPLLGQAILGWLVADNVVSKAGWINLGLGGLFRGMRAASAFERIVAIMRTGFGDFPLGAQVASNLALGAAMFLLAWLCFGRCTREQKDVSPSRGLLARKGRSWRLVRPGRAWSLPLAWKEFHFGVGGVSMLVIRFLLFGVVLAVIAWFMGPFDNQRIDWGDFGAVTMVLMIVLICIELVVHAARVFNSEFRWRTLSGLIVLPMSVRRLAYQKILGCLLCVVPYLLWFLVGLLLAPGAFADAIEGLLTEREGLIGVFQMLTQGLLLLHLVAFLSLVLKRGALALGLLIWYFGNSMLFGLVGMLIFPLGRLGPEVFFLLTGLFFLGLTVVLHLGIGRRLRRVAENA